MVPAVLQPLLAGPLAPYMSALRLPDAGTTSVRAAADLLQPQVMAATMARFRPADWRDHPRAVFSFWSQHYFLRLLPPVLAANLVLRHELPLALDDVGVVLADDGLPTAFVLKHEGQPLRQDVGVRDRFLLLRECHLAPLITAWSEQARLSERVFWSNVGRYLDWILAEARRLAPTDSTWRPLQVWLDGPYDRLGWHQRICCLRDRLPEVAMCPDCPKVKHV